MRVNYQQAAVSREVSTLRALPISPEFGQLASAPYVDLLSNSPFFG
jgi:hypothetical protein